MLGPDLKYSSGVEKKIITHEWSPNPGTVQKLANPRIFFSHSYRLGSEKEKMECI